MHDQHDTPVHDHDDPFHVNPTRELNVDEMDPANRSLAEALRISFGILKWVVAVLLIAFIGYGAYNQIEQGQVGIRVRLGAAVGEQVEQADGSTKFVVDVLEPSVYFTLPEPIEKIVLVPTRDQTVTIAPGTLEMVDPITGQLSEVMQTGFWFEVREDQIGKPLDEMMAKSGGLVPGRDGSLITADRNLVHGKWTVTYRITKENAADFAMNIGSTDRDESLRRAAALVRFAAERAIVHAVAATSVDDFVGSQIDAAAIRRLAQQPLDAMGSGITIAKVDTGTVTPPLPVRETFDDVTDAITNKKRAEEQALEYRSNILQAAAGRGYERVIAAIDAYREARATGNADAIAEADAALSALLTDEATLQAAGIGGRIARTVSVAEAEKKELVNTIRAEVEAFHAQQERFATDPQLRRITMQRMWLTTLRNIFRKDHEMFRIPQGAEHIYVELGPNTRVRPGRTPTE